MPRGEKQHKSMCCSCCNIKKSLGLGVTAYSTDRKQTLRYDTVSWWNIFIQQFGLLVVEGQRLSTIRRCFYNSMSERELHDINNFTIELKSIGMAMSQ